MNETEYIMSSPKMVEILREDEKEIEEGLLHLLLSMSSGSSSFETINNYLYSFSESLFTCEVES